MNIFRIIIVSTILGLSGCASLLGNGTDNGQTPVQLSAIPQKVKLNSLWKVSTGQKYNNTMGNFIPAQSGNMIFTVGSKGIVSALDTKTSKVIWRIDLDKSLVMTAGAANGVVVLGSENGDLYALNQSNGKTIWHQTLSSKLTSAPVIAGNSVVVKQLGGILTAFDLSKGTALWTVNHGAPVMVLSGGSTPRVVNDKVYVGFADGQLAVYSLNKGALLWTNQTTTPTGASDVEQMVDITSSPEIVNGRVFSVSYQGNLTAQNMNTGQTLWQQPLSSNKNIRLSATAVYAVDTSGVIWCFDQKTGNVIFKQEGLKYRGVTSPILVNGNIVVGDKEGYVHVLDANSGNIIGRAQVSGDEILALSADTLSRNQFYIFNLGSEINKYTI